MDAVAEKIIARDKKIENAVNNVAEYMRTNYGDEYAIYYLRTRLRDALNVALEGYTDAAIDIFNGYQLEPVQPKS
jgi:hypothetical protein